MSLERPSREVGDLQQRRDLSCIERIGRGDQDGFAELFARYGGPAYALASRVCREDGLAEEVMQEVFLAVWRRAGAYDPARGSVRAWLLTQVHHRAVDVVRREEAERRRTTQSSPDVPAERTDEQVIEEAWVAARRAAVRGALGALPPDQREVLSLAYYEGLTQTQVASRIGAPLGTVKSRTLSALRKLRSLLDEGSRE